MSAGDVAAREACALKRRMVTRTSLFVSLLYVPSFLSLNCWPRWGQEPGHLPVQGGMLGPGGAGGGPSPHPGLLVFSPRPAEKSPCVPRSGAGYGAALAGRDGDRWVGMALAGSRFLPPPTRRARVQSQGSRRGEAGSPCTVLLGETWPQLFLCGRLGSGPGEEHGGREAVFTPAGRAPSAGCFPPPVRDGGGTWRGPWAGAGVWGPPGCRPPPGSPRPAGLTLELGWGGGARLFL